MTATEALLRKALVTSGLDTAGWSTVQAGLRDRAFFMAEVERARVLAAARSEAAAILTSGKSLSEARRDLREALRADGYVPAAEDKGTIKDLFTRQRLDVMLKTNVAQARGYADYLAATSTGALMAFPAYEFIRVYQRKVPRADWRVRWDSAARAVGWQGVARGTPRMVALKTSPIWARLSRFDNPFPPFDFGSGMGLDDVDAADCRELGLGDQAKAQKPPRVDFNGSLQAEVPVAPDSPEAERLRSAFGDQVVFDGNVARWRGNLIRDVVGGNVRNAKLGRGYDGRNLSISHNIFADHLHKHFGEEERDRRNMPLSVGDFELIPAMWRKPDNVVKERNRDHLAFDTLDGGILNLIVDPVKGIVGFWKEKNPRAGDLMVSRLRATPAQRNPKGA